MFCMTKNNINKKTTDNLGEMVMIYTTDKRLIFFKKIFLSIGNTHYTRFMCTT